MVGAETASTADARHWDSTAPHGSCATDIVPSPNPRYLPGWSRALPTLQECDSTAVATIHLAYTLSLSRCLIPSDREHLTRTCLFAMWTPATCTAYHAHRFHLSHSVLFWAHTCKSFCSIWCPLRQVLPLALDSMAPCPINPSFSVLGYDQASLCLAHAFLSPWGGEGQRHPKKKTEMRMLVHCQI